MTIAIIPIIILAINSLIFVIDATISISGLVRMDKETFMTSGIDEMFGTIAELITVIWVVMLIFTII